MHAHNRTVSCCQTFAADRRTCRFREIYGTFRSSKRLADRGFVANPISQSCCSCCCKVTAQATCDPKPQTASLIRDRKTPVMYATAGRYATSLPGAVWLGVPHRQCHMSAHPGFRLGGHGDGNQHKQCSLTRPHSLDGGHFSAATSP